MATLTMAKYRSDLLVLLVSYRIDLGRVERNSKVTLIIPPSMVERIFKTIRTQKMNDFIMHSCLLLLPQD